MRGQYFPNVRVNGIIRTATLIAAAEEDKTIAAAEVAGGQPHQQQWLQQQPRAGGDGDGSGGAVAAAAVAVALGQLGSAERARLAREFHVVPSEESMGEDNSQVSRLPARRDMGACHRKLFHDDDEDGGSGGGDDDDATEPEPLAFALS